MAQVKRIKRPVNGVLLLNKPVGITSNAALQIARRLYQAERAGHTGTLDPFASGLLPLCFGEATKFSQYQLEADKTYRAVMRLGVTTLTGDPEGAVLETRPVDVTRAQVEAALAAFVGEIEQIPPMYSALKHRGKPLYEYARAGIEIERRPRRVTLRAIELIAHHDTNVTLEVTCSAGTYIRTLAEDIGRCLGCGAHLTALTRTASGGFELADAISLDTLEQLDMTAREHLLMPADGLVGYLPRVELDQPASTILQQGQRPRLGSHAGALGFARAYSPAGRFLGLIEVGADGVVTPRRLMSLPAQ